MKPENLRRWTIYIRLLSVSRNWYKTLSKLYQNVYMRFCIRFVVLNRPYSTNTQPIRKWLYSTRAWEFQIEVLYISFNAWDSQVSSCTPFHVSFTCPLKNHLSFNWAGFVNGRIIHVYMYSINSLKTIYTWKTLSKVIFLKCGRPLPSKRDTKSGFPDFNSLR